MLQLERKEWAAIEGEIGRDTVPKACRAPQPVGRFEPSHNARAG